MDIDKTGYYPEYQGDFEKSTFCLAATGAGYGVRAKLAVQRGCIPIVIADDVQVCTWGTSHTLYVLNVFCVQPEAGE